MAKWKIVISDYYYENLNQEYSILQAANAEVFDYHCKTEDEVVAVAHDCDALICQFAPISRNVIESMPKCKIIVRYAIGVDNIDLKAAEDNGIFVCNVPDYSIDEVSNHAIALLLDCARKLTYMTNQVKQGHNNYTAVKPLYRIAGKTLGLLGFGRIPRAVAKKMNGFGLKIIASDPYVAKQTAADLNVGLVSFNELVTQSDYLSIHVPLTDNTRHIFNKEVFKQMKPTAILINTARGAIVNENDLLWALENRIIGMAGIDVLESESFDPEHPIFKLDNAVVTPHVAWYSEDAVLSLQAKVAEEVSRRLMGQKPLHPVNKPTNPR